MFEKLLQYLYSIKKILWKMIATQSYSEIELRDQLFSEITTAIEIGQDPNASSEIRVHEMRRALKRLRSLLRLFKSECPKILFESIDTYLRNAGGALTDMREATVNLRIFLNLTQKNNFNIDPYVKENITHLLSERVRDVYSRDKEEFTKKINRSIFNINRAQQEMHSINMFDLSRKSLFSSVKKSYKKAAESYMDSINTLETEIIHRWRKHAKYLLLQIKLTDPFKDPTFDNLRGYLEVITETIGKEHDLAILENYIFQNIKLKKQDKQAIHLSISKNRMKLQKRAFESGAAIFVEPDKQKNLALFSL